MPEAAAAPATSTSPIPTDCPPPRCRRATTSSSSRTWPPSPSAAPAPPPCRCRPPPTCWCATPSSSRSRPPGSSWPTAAGWRPPRRAGRRDRAAHAAPGRPAGAGHLRAAHRVHRPAQRQAARLLPQHLHRRPGRRAGHRHHPVRGHRRPAGLPLLGRARAKAVFAITLVVDPDLAAISNAAETGRTTRRRRQGDRVLRRHHRHVHLPGGLHRGPAGGDRAGRRGRHPAARRLPAGQGPPDRLRASRSAPSACASSPTTSACPTPATRSTWWPCPTSPSGPWRTWAASPSARPWCWSSRPR